MASRRDLRHRQQEPRSPRTRRSFVTEGTLGDTFHVARIRPLNSRESTYFGPLDEKWLASARKVVLSTLSIFVAHFWRIGRRTLMIATQASFKMTRAWPTWTNWRRSVSTVNLSKRARYILCPIFLQISFALRIERGLRSMKKGSKKVYVSKDEIIPLTSQKSGRSDWTRLSAVEELQMVTDRIEFLYPPQIHAL